MKHKLFPALAFLSVLFIELDLKYVWIVDLLDLPSKHLE